MPWIGGRFLFVLGLGVSPYKQPFEYFTGLIYGFMINSVKQHSVWVGFLWSVVFLFFSCQPEPEIKGCEFTDYYYSGSQKIQQNELDPEFILLVFDISTSNATITSFVKNHNAIREPHEFEIIKNDQTGIKCTVVKVIEPGNCQQNSILMQDLENEPLVINTSYCSYAKTCQNDFWMPLGDRCVDSYDGTIFVELKSKSDYHVLANLASQTNSEVFYTPSISNTDSLYYNVKTTKNSTGDGLYLSNYFYESGYFQDAVPGIVTIPVE